MIFGEEGGIEESDIFYYTYHIVEKIQNRVGIYLKELGGGGKPPFSDWCC